MKKIKRIECIIEVLNFPCSRGHREFLCEFYESSDAPPRIWPSGDISEAIKFSSFEEADDWLHNGNGRVWSSDPKVRYVYVETTFALRE